jgi:hypothetical protein
MDWYFREDKFDPEKVVRSWNEKLSSALQKGYEGMRVNGNEAWFHGKDWKDFMKFEKGQIGSLRGTHHCPMHLRSKKGGRHRCYRCGTCA